MLRRVLLLACCAALLGGCAAAPAPATPTSACDDYTALLTIDTPPTPRAGEQISVTARLANAGCGLMGMQGYSRRLAPEGDEALTEPAVMAEARATPALQAGESDVVAVPLRLVHPGRLTITSRTRFEFHPDSTMRGSWGYAEAAPLTVTIAAPASDVPGYAARPEAGAR